MVRYVEAHLFLRSSRFTYMPRSCALCAWTHVPCAAALLLNLCEHTPTSQSSFAPRACNKPLHLFCPACSDDMCGCCLRDGRGCLCDDCSSDVPDQCYAGPQRQPFSCAGLRTSPTSLKGRLPYRGRDLRAIREVELRTGYTG
jgi:hypothetical protein